MVYKIKNLFVWVGWFGNKNLIFLFDFGNGKKK